MKKINTFKKNINEVKKMTSKFPKSINEALNFNDFENESDEMDFQDEEEQMNDPRMNMKNNPKGEIKQSADELINDIRKKALRAMADLADTPEDPNYETLKKIFTMLDKAVSDKQEQREVMAKNPNMQQANQNM